MNRTRLALGLALSAATPAFAQLLNGSFETGSAYPGGLNIFSSGTPAPWVATSFTPDLYDNTGVDGWAIGTGVGPYNGMFQGMPAAAGVRFIGFGASTGFGGINEAFQQTTALLTPGTTYTVSAMMAADDAGKAIPYGGPYFGRGQVSVLFNGNLVGTFTQNTASMTWQARTISFVAPAATSAVFTFVAQLDPVALANGTPANSYIGLDDFRLVPAPGSAALLGLAGITCARRRRRWGSSW